MLSEKAREAKRAYQRAWYAKTNNGERAERRKQYREAYWERMAAAQDAEAQTEAEAQTHSDARHLPEAHSVPAGRDADSMESGQMPELCRECPWRRGAGAE